MLSSRYQLFKRLITSHPFKIHISVPFQTSPFKIPMYFFSSYQFRQTSYKEDIPLLTDLSREKLAQTNQVMDQYAKCEDLSLLAPNKTIEISLILYQLAFAHKSQGNIDKAYRYLREDEELLHKSGIRDTLPLASNYFLRAEIYIERNNLADAQHYLNKIDSICKTFNNIEYARTLRLRSWCSLANVYKLKDDQDRALDLLNSILDNINDLAESSRPALLRDVYKAMASIYSSRQDVEKAKDAYLKCIEVATKYHGEDSMEVFTIYVELTTFLYQHGQNELALKMAQKLLQVAERAFSKESVEAAQSQLLLGLVQIALGDYDKALASCQKALKTFEKTPEKHLSSLMNTYHHLMRIHYFTGDDLKARDFLTKADQTLVQEKSSNPFGLAEMYLNWAQDLQGFEKLAGESKNYFRKALDIYKNSEPLDMGLILQIYLNLATLAYQEEDWEKAKEYAEESEKYFDETTRIPMIYGTIDYLLSCTYLDLNKYEECEKRVQKILKSSEATGFDEFVAPAYNNLGILNERQGNLKEAVEALKKGIQYEENREEKDLSRLETMRETLLRCESSLKDSQNHA